MFGTLPRFDIKVIRSKSRLRQSLVVPCVRQLSCLFIKQYTKKLQTGKEIQKKNKNNKKKSNWMLQPSGRSNNGNGCIESLDKDPCVTFAGSPRVYTPKRTLIHLAAFAQQAMRNYTVNHRKCGNLHLTITMTI